MAEKILAELFKWIEDNLSMNVLVQTTENNLAAAQIPGSFTASVISSLYEWSSTSAEIEYPARPEAMCIEELVSHTQKEMRSYLETGKSNTAYGFELFRRALDAQDEVAWSALLQAYSGLVKSWVINHSYFASSGEEVDYFVNRAFERMWRYVALKPGKFANFTDLAALLQYTKLCAHAAVMDDSPTLPAVVNHTDASSEQTIEFSVHQLSSAQQKISSHFDGANFEQVEKNEFWQLVEKFLVDEVERVVLFGFFIDGLKNRELLELYPEHFKDTKQISNKRTSILRRLARNPNLNEVLQDFFHDERDRFGTLIC